MDLIPTHVASVNNMCHGVARRLRESRPQFTKMKDAV